MYSTRFRVRFRVRFRLAERLENNEDVSTAVISPSVVCAGIPYWQHPVWEGEGNGLLPSDRPIDEICCAVCVLDMWSYRDTTTSTVEWIVVVAWRDATIVVVPSPPAEPSPAIRRWSARARLKEDESISTLLNYPSRDFDLSFLSLFFFLKGGLSLCAVSILIYGNNMQLL